MNVKDIARKQRSYLIFMLNLKDLNSIFLAGENSLSTKHNIDYFFEKNLKLLSTVGLKCSFEKKGKKFKLIQKLPAYLLSIQGIIVLPMNVYFLMEVIQSNTLLSLQIISQIISNMICLSKVHIFYYKMNCRICSIIYYFIGVSNCDWHREYPTNF